MNRFTYGVTSVLPSCILAVLENIVGVITLGYYVPPWSFQFMCWKALRRR